jgi:hypothetical protein
MQLYTTGTLVPSSDPLRTPLLAPHSGVTKKRKKHTHKNAPSFRCLTYRKGRYTEPLRAARCARDTG